MGFWAILTFYAALHFLLLPHIPLYILGHCPLMLLTMQRGGGGFHYIIHIIRVYCIAILCRGARVQGQDLASIGRRCKT